ncbi:MAG: MHYT domain-containing protein [Gemmatimonadales bacterium]
MNAHHHPSMAVLSILVAILASYIALDLAGRVAAAREGFRMAWLVRGAGAWGPGTWATHFVAMLAIHLPGSYSRMWGGLWIG